MSRASTHAWGPLAPFQHASVSFRQPIRARTELVSPHWRFSLDFGAHSNSPELESALFLLFFSSASRPAISRIRCRRFELPAPSATSPFQELQIDKRHQNQILARAPLFPKFVLGCWDVSRTSETAHECGFPATKSGPACASVRPALLAFLPRLWPRIDGA